MTSMYLGTESIRKEENGRNMLEIVPGYDRIEEVKALFSEYTEMLVSLDPFFHLYLDIQHYDDEEKNPAEKYRMPDGRLYSALCNGKAAGCIALRKLNENDGEGRDGWLQIAPGIGENKDPERYPFILFD